MTTHPSVRGTDAQLVSVPLTRLVCAALLALASLALLPSARAADNVLTDWQSTGERTHPLVGRIWSPRTRAFLTPQDLAARIRSADTLLLGEVHDNPDHHRIQGWAIDTVATHRRAQGLKPPAVVFEQIRTDQQVGLEQFAVMRRTSPESTSADALFRVLDWEHSGWPAAAIYRPVFKAVIDAQLPIMAGDAAKGRTHRIARQGLSSDEKSTVGLDNAMPQPLADALTRELKDSHCGMLPDKAIPGMALAQRFRDAHLAKALLTARKEHGAAILIAGNGHVRTDRGVPWYLRDAAAHVKALVIAQLEVEAGETDPNGYPPQAPDGTTAADILVFTPRAERPDPCEGLRKQGKEKP